MAAALPTATFRGILIQIRDGAGADTWSVIEDRTPELATLVDRADGR